MNVPDDWLILSASDIFYFLVNPDILPSDAIYIEEATALTIKMLHRVAARNNAKKIANSEGTRKACLAFWEDCLLEWRKPTEAGA